MHTGKGSTEHKGKEIVITNQTLYTRFCDMEVGVDSKNIAININLIPKWINILR